jgi:DNA-binding PucR family transcriptional regulator
VFGLGEPLPALAGAIVLAVGFDTEDAQVSLVRELSGSEAAAVVFKSSDGLDAALLVAAEQSGVAILTAPRALLWGQLYTLLLTAMSVTPSADVDAPLGDLFALVDAVAAMVGGATTIEDPQNRVLAYSTLDQTIDSAREQTILGRQVPDDWIKRLHDTGVFRRLWQTDDVVSIGDFTGEDTDTLRRIAVAVRAGGELLGSLWVIEGTQKLGPEAEQTLRQAADIAALHLLRHRSASDVDRQRRTTVLSALLDGHEGQEQVSEVLGVSPVDPTAVIAFDLGSGTDANAVMNAQRMADLVAVYCESYRRRAACAPSRGRVYAVVPTDAGRVGERLVALAQDIVERANQALRLTVRAGIGSAAPGLDGVVRSRREADDVLDALAAVPDGQVAMIETVRAQVTLHRLTQACLAHPELAEGKVTALAQQDAEKGTAWVPTLRAYFDAFGDMSKAAAEVSVHPNTFRYRMRRITEVFGLDLNDPDERLVAELQLRLIGRT